MLEYRLIHYFDVWGNAEDGYEVNNLCEEPDRVHLPEQFTKEDVLSELQYIGFAKDTATVDMFEESLMGDIDFIEFDEVLEDGPRPLFRLELIN